MLALLRLLSGIVPTKVWAYAAGVAGLLLLGAVYTVNVRRSAVQEHKAAQTVKDLDVVTQTQEAVREADREIEQAIGDGTLDRRLRERGWIE